MTLREDIRFFPGQHDALREEVRCIVDETPVIDMHTHLYHPAFGGRLLWGIDDLLTYHYLVAELFRATRISYEEFWKRSKSEQADLIWRELFVKRSPISEACRGVVTVLNTLGLDPGGERLDDFRAYFREQNVGDYVDFVFERAHVRSVVMTNDPFDDAERPVWLGEFRGDPRFRAALRIDPLLNDWPAVCPRLKQLGYAAASAFDAETLAEVRRFLSEWLDRTGALYLAVSLPPEFAYPEESPRNTILIECVLPVAREHHVPFALMVGVRRRMNPALQLAGDGVGRADVAALSRLCADFPDNKFLATYLSRENQHELCVAARKHPNLLVFGCWWFLNNPSLVEEITRMRLEMLGLGFVPQHSDARVLDQLLYKWPHSRAIIARVLADKYADLLEAGRPLAQSTIRTDVEQLFRRNFSEFVGS